MVQFGESAGDKFKRQKREAMLCGTWLEHVQPVPRARVLKAAKAFGWRETDWATKKYCRILARAMRNVRDNMQVEGLVLGLDRIDQAMHMLCSGLGLRPAQLSR
jgi:hypothetical protein